MRVTWQKFDWVEVQVFEPEAASKKAILFCPGLPGMGATVFEQRHAAALCSLGYYVLVIKHKGVRLDSPFAPLFVNNGARLMESRKKKETHLGGGPAKIKEWLKEPAKVLSVIADKFDDIHVIGNSFGALSAMYALTKKDMVLGNVKTLLFYAGAQGIWVDGDEFTIARIWKPAYLMMPHITQKVEILDPEKACDELRDVYMDMPKKVQELPETIKIKYLVVKNDEILWQSDTEAFRDAIGGRGEIIIDEIDRAWPEAGLLAHDTPDYKTEDLIKLIEG
jgi:pimeloyl-ACP methyl ester carboxylesterase